MQAGDFTPDLTVGVGLDSGDGGGESSAEMGGYGGVVGEGFGREGDGQVRGLRGCFPGEGTEEAPIPARVLPQRALLN